MMDGWDDSTGSNTSRIDDVEFTDRRPDRSSLPSYGEFEPILDRVLVRRIEAESTVEGTGLVVAEKYRQHSNKGEVVAVGKYAVLGTEVFAMSEFVAPGDIVLYGEYSAERFLKDNDVLWIVRLADIRGVQRRKSE